MVNGMLAFSDTIASNVAVYFAWSDVTKKLKMLFTQHSAHYGGRMETIDNLESAVDALNTVITTFCDNALPSGSKNKTIMQNTLTLNPIPWVTPLGPSAAMLKDMVSGANLLHVFCEGMNSLGLPSSYYYKVT